MQFSPVTFMLSKDKPDRIFCPLMSYFASFAFAARIV